MKARHDVRGFEKKKKFNLILLLQASLWIVMSVAASEGWNCEIIDIKSRIFAMRKA